MLFVAVIVIIAFTFFYDAGRGPDREKKQELFRIDGKSYTQTDYEKLLYKLNMVFSQLRSMEYINFATQITSVRNDQSQRGMGQAFAYNLTILRNRAKDLGIYVSNEEVENEIQRMDRFQVRDTMGQPLNRFNPAAWEYFKQTILAGDFTEEDFAQLIKDKISYVKLTELVGSGVIPSSHEVDMLYKKENQNVIAYVIKETIEKAKEGIEVTEEKIAEHYTELKTTNNALLDKPEKRSFEYAFFPNPTYVKPEPAPEPAPDPAPLAAALPL